MPKGSTGSSYNRDQEEALLQVCRHLGSLDPGSLRLLEDSIRPYLDFREEVSRFQEEHLSETCTLKCFRDRRSACCGREGILTFFADVVINVLQSSTEGLERLFRALSADRGGPSCVYLGEGGCQWKVKPIVCEMFLCEHARKAVLAEDTHLLEQWEGLRRREKVFTFPDRSVLFDDLEKIFLDAGLDSPLMYCHKSPGLLLLKKRHGVGLRG